MLRLRHAIGARFVVWLGGDGGEDTEPLPAVGGHKAYVLYGKAALLALDDSELHDDAGVGVFVDMEL